MKRIVTIGFEPWGQHTVNTSWDALQAARPHLPDGVLLEKRQLGVSWSRADSLVEEVVAGEPDAVLAFGQAPRDVVSLEALAFNQASVSETDNDGILREESVIDSGGPDQFDSSLPIEAILERLQAQGIGCERSLSAGDYRPLGSQWPHRWRRLVRRLHHRPQGPLGGCMRIQEFRAASQFHRRQGVMREQVGTCDRITTQSAGKEAAALWGTAQFARRSR